MKAIETSNLRVTAQVDGMMIHVRLPELSQERREELGKHVRRLSEDRRIELRHVRDEANKSVQRSEDDQELIATTDGIRASERASFQAVCDLEPYWEGVGQLDAPFESGLASPTGRVSAHKIPSGQRQPAPAGDRAGPGRQVRERCTPRPTRSSEKS